MKAPCFSSSIQTEEDAQLFKVRVDTYAAPPSVIFSLNEGNAVIGPFALSPSEARVLASFLYAAAEVAEALTRKES